MTTTETTQGQEIFDKITTNPEHHLPEASDITQLINYLIEAKIAIFPRPITDSRDYIGFTTIDSDGKYKHFNEDQMKVKGITGFSTLSNTMLSARNFELLRNYGHEGDFPTGDRERYLCK